MCTAGNPCGSRPKPASSRPRAGSSWRAGSANSGSTITDRDQAPELERVLNLGARPADIGQTGQESWHVLADAERNEFCLLKAHLDPL